MVVCARYHHATLCDIQMIHCRWVGLPATDLDVRKDEHGDYRVMIAAMEHTRVNRDRDEPSSTAELELNDEAKPDGVVVQVADAQAGVPMKGHASELA